MNTESEWKNNGTSCQFFSGHLFSGLLALHVKSSSLSGLEIDKEKNRFRAGAYPTCHSTELQIIFKSKG